MLQTQYKNLDLLYFHDYFSIKIKFSANENKMSEPVTSQPKSGDNLTVGLPEFDFHQMVKGEWKVGNFECLKNPQICKKYLISSFI